MWAPLNSLSGQVGVRHDQGDGTTDSSWIFVLKAFTADDAWDPLDPS